VYLDRRCGKGDENIVVVRSEPRGGTSITVGGATGTLPGTAISPLKKKTGMGS